MPRLLSVNVGLPRDVTWNGKTVRTSVWKSPVAGRRIVRKLNIDGDAQADLAGHGGEHRAVFVYQMDSYHYWERFLGRNDFTFGQFGENFTVEGLPDNEVCIGDRYRIGGAEFEVTQPRVTCYRVGIRMNEPRMPALLVAHHRPGFYFRVLQEGEVGAGDDIVKIADGPEKMSVADVDALLYLPGRSSEQLQRALQIPALSKGWQSSFQAMLQQDLSSKTTVGNPGLASEEQAPAWPGFRQMRVANIHKESASVTSFILTPIDGRPFPLYQAGQFVVVRVFVDPGKPPVLRSYSLSDLPAADHFRISVKSELNGIASSFLCDRAREGDLLEVSAPRGTFTLRPSQSPVVLLSAGVGATPVMSMLHSLVAEKSQREIWWIYGARNGVDHPFAEESRFLLKRLSRGRGYIVYSRPSCKRPSRRQSSMLPGTLTQLCWRESECHEIVTSICAGPLHSCRTCAMGCETGVCSPKMCTRKSSVLSRLSPRVWRRSFTLLTCHKGRRDLALQSHSRVAGLPPRGTRNSRACLNWRKHATFRSDGRAGLESVIPA